MGDDDTAAVRATCPHPAQKDGLFRDRRFAVVARIKTTTIVAHAYSVPIKVEYVIISNLEIQHALTFQFHNQYSQT